MSIEIKDIGPIVDLSIPVPPAGGVVVLTGRNGKGKTEALNAVESLVTGSGKLSVRDGALRGTVEGWGGKISVAKSTRRSGELEVVGLEGRLNVADLVDPGIASEEAADAKRIKALITLSGVEPSVELFYGLFGGRDSAEAVVGELATESDDLVQMAARIKRDCEAKARKQEDGASYYSKRTLAAREATEGVNLDAEDDDEALQKHLYEAITANAEIEADAKAAREKLRAAEEARVAMAPHAKSYSGATAEDSRKAEEAAASLVVTLRNQLDDAKTALESRTKERRLAEEYESALAAWSDQIEAAESVTVPSDEDRYKSTNLVNSARKAVEQGVLVRKAKKLLEKAAGWHKLAKDEQAIADRLRECGKGVDDVLSGVVSEIGSSLRVEAGRLVLDTNRGTTHFGDLSEGERWKISLDIGIDAIGAAGVLVVPQHAWEGLDDINRKLIAEHVKGRGVTVLTAESSVDETVAAEPFGGGS